MTHNAKIAEIFDSVQGEGPYIGYRQLFVRFCGCNLLCDYCDTVFDKGDVYTVENLLDKIYSYKLKSIHSISLTGGEPLLHYEFLETLLPHLKKHNLKIYLETNGTLARALKSIIDYVDIISMDFKLNSSSKIGDLYSAHDEFLATAVEHNKEIFAKLVFDESVQDFEINECIRLAKKYNISIILQPKMNGNKIAVSHDKILQVFNYFSDNYQDTRLIGQVHKFFDIQ